MSVLALDFALERGAFELAVTANVDLDGITAVFGPSGSGKTTLLRAVAGLEPPRRGHITCGDVVWDDGTRHVPAHRRRVAYVFQDGRLFPHLDVAGNLGFAIRHARAAGPIAFADVVDALGLEPLLGRRPAQLSGGEQQRAAIARALLSNPRLLLMDEPLASLDTGRRSEIAAYIEELPRRFAMPILYVTHAIDEVIRLASRMLLLAEGALVAHGRVEDILERIDLWPLTGRLEAGSIVGAVVAGHAAGMTTLGIGEQKLNVPAISVALGRTVRLRIPARDVVIATERPTHLSIRNVLSARVARIDLDATVFAEILLDLGAEHLRARITRAALNDLGLAVGQSVFALVKSVAVDTALLR